jgi:phosphoribosylformylglycinamidine cyclo-ligase
MSDARLSYADAGVNIDVAQAALSSVGDAIKATHGPAVLGGVGGFGGLFDANFEGMTRPVLVSSIDGVGTKTKVAEMTGDWSGIGRDIVNHCVNDILCQGARPLFFLDYFGCAWLDAGVFNQVVGGAAAACAEVGCALIGGETAEMPGVYHDGEIDLVGSVVGVVDFDRKLPKPMASAGDRLVGIASNGLHTNGYSLARKALLDVGGMSVRDALPGTEMTIGEALLLPHKCYFNSVHPLLQEFPSILAAAHITGGGLSDNLPRVLTASNLTFKINRRSWEPLPIFRMIQAMGRIEDAEMYRAFNMGIGMVLIVQQEDSAAVVERLNAAGEHAAEIGKLQPGPLEVEIV